MTIDSNNQTPIYIRLDERGFHDVFNHFYTPLCLFAFQYMEDHEAAADIVQECFAQLWQIRSGFIYLHQVKSFLYMSVRNRSINELEHRRVVADYADRVQRKVQDAFFEDALVEQETYRILNEAIERLPMRMKEVIRLAMEGKKNAEIAEELDCSVETVKTLRRLAYQKLRVSLKDYYYCLLLLGLSMPS